MKQREGKRKKRAVFTRREFIKTSLIVAAILIMGATTLIIGSSLGPSTVRAEKPIKIGLFGLCSGSSGISGEAGLYASTLWAEGLNSKGGLLGRKIEITQRDTFNKPEEAVRYIREWAAADVDFLLSTGSTAEAFAVAAVSKETKKIICMVPETSEFTANPQVRSRYCFRTARNNLLDNIWSGKYAGKVSKERGLTRWVTIGPDYAYGRDSVAIFLEYLKKSNPKVEVVAQVWPKLFESDFTPQITAIMAARPDAVYTVLNMGELLAFIKQGAMYGIFDKAKFFHKDLSDVIILDPIVKAIGKLPPGMYAGTRCLRHFPDTKANHEWHDAYVKRFNTRPINHAWEINSAVLLLEEAVKKANTTETEAVIRALEGLSVKAPVGMGPNGTVEMRSRDHQLINYAMGWGVTLAGEPFLTDIEAGSWDEVIAEETIWLKNKGWL